MNNEVAVSNRLPMQQDKTVQQIFGSGLKFEMRLDLGKAGVGKDHRNTPLYFQNKALIWHLCKNNGFLYYESGVAHDKIIRASRDPRDIKRGWIDMNNDSEPWPEEETELPKAQPLPATAFDVFRWRFKDLIKAVVVGVDLVGGVINFIFKRRKNAEKNNH